MIDFGGADMLNAGLLAERYAKYDRATADRMTRDELALMGPRSAPNEDSEGGTLGSWSQYQPVTGGQNFLGQGANLGSSLGAQSRTPQLGGTSAGFNPYLPTQIGNQGYFNPNQNSGGPGHSSQPYFPEGGQPRNPNSNMWASRYSGYRIPYGNRRYYPGMGAAPRFQPRQAAFQPPSQWQGSGQGLGDWGGGNVGHGLDLAFGPGVYAGGGAPSFYNNRPPRLPGTNYIAI
jgi:hypothetical protein